VRVLQRSQVNTVELPDRLQFVVSRENGWSGYLFLSVTVLLFFYAIWINKSWLMLALLAMGILYFIANRSYSPTDKLTVTENEIIASRDRDLNSTGTIRVADWELVFLGYTVGDEDEPPGLYAYLDTSKICLIPDLQEKETNVITDAIRRKFPLLERGDQSSTSLLHGEESGITTLGLSSAASNKSASNPPKS
jgi:hypothetical protein